MVKIADSFTVATCHDVIDDFNQHFVDVGETRRLRQHHIINVNFQLEAANQELCREVKQIQEQMFTNGIENSHSIRIKVWIGSH